MIIKFAGLIAVFLSSSAIGFCVAEQLSVRERELINLVKAIELMEGELMYTAASVKEIILGIAPCVKGICAEMFESMCRDINCDLTANCAWENAADKFADAICLKREDKDYLKSSSYLLTAYELNEQRTRFEELKCRVQSLLRDAQMYKKKNTGLARMLGVYGGALLCIIIF